MATGRAEPLLDIADLSIALPSGVRLVEQASFVVGRGETVAIVGESGCGKSVTALAIMGLLPPAIAKGVRGRIGFEGRDLRTMPAEDLRQLRGNRLAMIFQEPLTALNPVMTIGAQVAEVLTTHKGLTAADAAGHAVALLKRVRIPDAASRAHDYPHRLSGGMRQRVTIAMAIACGPAMLIADEATTALDVTVQAQILDLLKDLQDSANLGLLLITHDLGIVRQSARRVIVMYAGLVVESGPAAAVLRDPRHPYTAGLLAARPTGSHAAEGHRLLDIQGAVPAPENRPSGCVFEPRCGRAKPDCREARPPLAVDGDRAWSCFHPVGGP